MSIQSILVPVPNLGFECALSELGVVPLATDVIGDINKLGGVGFSVETVDATAVNSASGFSRKAPTVKTAKDISVTLFKTNAGYTKIAEKILDTPTTDDGFYRSLTLIYPKRTGVNDTIPDYTYNGFITDLSLGDVETNAVQTFSFVFTPVEEPVEFTAFRTA